VGIPYNFIGYAPDTDPTTPGVITDCTMLIPSRRGMKAAPSAAASEYAALAAACKGAASLRKLDASVRVFAGTGTALFEAASGTYTDRTRVSGGAYTLGSEDRWRFAQFGNVSLAAAKTDTLQSSSSGAFANISGAPKAACIDTASNFVMLGDYNDGTDTPDGWFCSGIGDETVWTPAIATQCANGRLRQTPGKIRAMRAFGSGMVAYKDRSMFLGVYVGPPEIWSWSRVPGEIGTSSQEAVVNVGTPENPRHIFTGPDDFYSFDGARPVPLGESWVKEAVFGTAQRSRMNACITLHESQANLVYFWYPSVDSFNPDKCVVYNYRTNRWGRADRQIEMAFEYVTPATTYADVGTLFSTYASIGDIAYGGSFWVSGVPSPGIFDTSHLLKTLDGAPSASTLTTGDIGDDEREILLRQVKPRYLSAPTTATMTNYYRQNIGDGLTADGTVSQMSSRFDVLREARWHRLGFSFSGSVELPGLTLDAVKQGLE
jgi:hypothetical protein